MRYTHHRAALITVLAILCALFPVAASASGAATVSSVTNRRDTDVYPEIDNYLRTSVEAAHIPALSITIVDSDSVLFSAVYGETNATETTPFLLGSVSKSFTAVAIMQLVEQGKVDLNAVISTYLPDVAEGDNITVRQLLNHTSGLGEYQTLKDYRIVHDQSEHHYANVNYALLGKIIESVTGESYDDYLRVNVIGPLSLSKTSATAEQSRQDGLVSGYTDYFGFNVEREPQYPSSWNDWITVPAGYLAASTADLGRYLQMYLRGGEGILAKQSIDAMLYGDTVYVSGDVPYWYGYGWAMVQDPLPEVVFRHAGLVETGTSCVFLLPQSDIGIALAANVNDYFVGNEMLDTIGWGVVLRLLGQNSTLIESNAFTTQHILIDLILLGILAIGILACCLVPGNVRRFRTSKKSHAVVFFIFFSVLIPIVLLLLPGIIFGVPLWVVRAFVPDVYLTLIVSSALVLGSGIVQLILVSRPPVRSTKTFTPHKRPAAR